MFNALRTFIGLMGLGGGGAAPGCVAPGVCPGAAAGAAAGVGDGEAETGAGVGAVGDTTDGLIAVSAGPAVAC